MGKISSEIGTKTVSEGDLEAFIFKVPDFDRLTASGKIDFFVYYLTIESGESGTTGAMIRQCFSALKLTPYSNIPAYLKDNSSKGLKGKQKFVLGKGQYHLERSFRQELETKMSKIPNTPPSNSYFPLTLFDNTRGYLVKIAAQAAKCYDLGLYDACAVMTRKLLEVLIIEVFERHGLSSKIKGPNNNFFYLSDLIDTLLIETTWNVGRNARQSIPSLKKMGDQSAHNRRYFVQQTEIEKVKDDLRIVLEELLHLIDYPNWK